MLHNGPDPAYTPDLDTPNPFVEASRAGDEDAFRVLAAAGKLNEPRVRELIALAKQAREEMCVRSFDYLDGPRVSELLEKIEFGLGALLPPVNIRISTRLAQMISQSGRKAA